MNKKNKNGWIVFVASRFVRHGEKSSTANVFSVLGIAVGVLALTVIIAVMNGFQLGFIESILEISSYHVRINSFPIEKTEVINDISKLPYITSIDPFKELKGIMRTKEPARLSEQTAAVLRAVPPDTYLYDVGMANHLEIIDGSFDLSKSYSIVLGSEVADALEVSVGDEIDFWTIASNVSLGDMMAAVNGESGENPHFTISGIFRSGYYEYDLSWGFINIDDAFLFDAAEDGTARECTLGIKLKNRWKVDRAAAEIQTILEKVLGSDFINENNITVTTWRDYNKTFFGALRTEKLLMFILVGLIFIVVALNIYQAQRRSVFERMEEIGLLRSVGATSLSVRLIFMFDGVIIGAAGSLCGMIPALLIATHIKEFFTFIESSVNYISYHIAEITGSSQNAYSIFSPKIFYIKEIPSRIIPHEVVLIFLFGFLSAVLASWAASKKVTGIKPAQILRYE
ncbi:MAG: ABC transporter permease [Termitinemataceae bacterium]|nr:MAG: ABC transporter permease [Termitinemataceae bacterium]